MKRLISAGIAAAVLTITMSSIASAGGWVTISDAQRPAVVYQDVDFRVSFAVLHHGETPMGGQQPEVTFTHAETGETHTASAIPSKIEGVYTAEVALPDSGVWNWEVSLDFYGTHTLAPFTVADGPTAVAGASTSSTLTDRALPLSLLGIGVVAGFAALWFAGWIGLPGVFGSVPGRQRNNPFASGNQR